MTFNINTPNAGESPGVFPTQNNTNFAVLKTIINVDHIFNNTPAPGDNSGTHRQVTMTARALPASLPNAGTNAILYTFLDSLSVAQLGYYNGVTNFQITPGIVAAVNFDGTGALGNQTIRSKLNVSSVDKTASGSYTINLSPPLPDNNYIVQITGMRNTNSVSFGCVLGNTVYGNSVAVGSIKVIFVGQNISLQDVFMGNITIMRY